MIAMSELPNAPNPNTNPMFDSESPRASSKKFGVSGWAMYMAKTANPITPKKYFRRVLSDRLSGGASGSC